MKTRRESKTAGGGQGGSVVLFVLFVALAVAVLVQALSIVVVASDRGKDAEQTGRDLLLQKQQALLEARQSLLVTWSPQDRIAGSESSGSVSTTAATISASGGWALDVSASQPDDVSPIVVSTWMERGRDGVDLPSAALVADRVVYEADRVLPWSDVDQYAFGTAGLEEAAVVWLREAPPPGLVGERVSVRTAAAPWALDETWRLLFGAGAAGETGVAATSSVTALGARDGQTVRLPGGCTGRPGAPVLIVVTGGGALDARGLGDLYGVVVVDHGGVLLDGTRVHGALFVTGDADLGRTGQLLFARDTLRWATDRSLIRVRLVPGTRREIIR